MRGMWDGCGVCGAMCGTSTRIPVRVGIVHNLSRAGGVVDCMLLDGRVRYTASTGDDGRVAGQGRIELLAQRHAGCVSDVAVSMHALHARQVAVGLRLAPWHQQTRPAAAISTRHQLDRWQRTRMWVWGVW